MSASRLILPLQKALRVSNSIYTVSWVLIHTVHMKVQNPRAEFTSSYSQRYDKLQINTRARGRSRRGTLSKMASFIVDSCRDPRFSLEMWD